MKINEQINKIYKDAKLKCNKIIEQAEKNVNKLKHGMIFCSKDNYCAKYFKTKNEIRFGNYGCNDYIKKSDYYFIEVEDYRRILTYQDAGYGDDDCFRYEHTLTKYKVCKHCGRCNLIEEKILDHSKEWSRSNSENCPKDYIPYKWKPTIKIIKGKNK